MADAENDVIGERLAPEAAFELLAHEIRLQTLEVLNDADERLSFGELRDRVGVEDPGKFNYHLQKLTGRFVRANDGYRLSAAGKRVVGAVLSGGYTAEFADEVVPMDAGCSVCEGRLEARFSGERARILCSNCEWTVTAPRIPPGVFEGWPRDVSPEVVDRWRKRNRVSAAYGFCYNCDGRLDQTICLPDDDGAPDWFHGHISDAVEVSSCRRCGHWWHTVVEQAVVTHPAVAAFHYDHGIDVRETPDWALPWVDHGQATVTDTDPLRIEVPVAIDDARRVFTFDGDLSLVAWSDDD